MPFAASIPAATRSIWFRNIHRTIHQLTLYRSHRTLHNTRQSPYILSVIELTSRAELVSKILWTRWSDDGRTKNVQNKGILPPRGTCRCWKEEASFIHQSKVGPLPSSSGSVKSLYFVQLLALDMYDNHNIPYRSSKPGLKLNEL